MKIFVLLLALLGSIPIHAAIVSSAVRLDPDALPLDTKYPNIFTGHGPVWSDYTLLFGPSPDYLLGAELVRTRYADNADPDFQLRITLDVPATVFLFIDNRIPDIAALMPWVPSLGFTDTGDDIRVEAGNSSPTTMAVYRGQFPAGDIVLLQQNAPGELSPPGMYIVGAVPEPASVWLLLCATAFWVTRRAPRHPCAHRLMDCLHPRCVPKYNFSTR